MIKKIFDYFKKKEPTLIWRNIYSTQFYGVIGWSATDRKKFIKGEDTWQR